MHANAVQVMDKSMVLGKATIRAARELALSNAALARVIGFSEPTISRISDGLRGIDPSLRIPLMADSDFIAIADSVPGDGGHVARVS